MLVLEDGTTLRGDGVRRRRRDVRRDGLQHRDDRLPGDADRPVVLRPDRGDDRAAHRQHRRQRRGPGDRTGSGSAATWSASRRGSPRAGGPGAAWTTELKAQGITGIAVPGTRALTMRLREHGAMRAAVSTVEDDPRRLLDRVLASPGMTGADLARIVTTPHPYTVSPPERHRDQVPGRRRGPRHQGRDPAEHGRRAAWRSGCCPPRSPPRRSWPPTRTACSSPTAQATRPRPGTRSPRCAACSTAGVPVFGICFGSQILGRASGWAPTSCASGTAA